MEPRPAARGEQQLLNSEPERLGSLALIAVWRNAIQRAEGFSQPSATHEGPSPNQRHLPAGQGCWERRAAAGTPGRRHSANADQASNRLTGHEHAADRDEHQANGDDDSGARKPAGTRSLVGAFGTSHALVHADAKPLETFEVQPQSRGALVFAKTGLCFTQQRARPIGVTLSEPLAGGVQHLVGLTLALGERGPRPVDIRACARMRSVEKEDARPQVDGLLVLSQEIPFEAIDEERLRPAVAIDGTGAHR